MLVFSDFLIQACFFPLVIFNNDAVAQNVVQVAMNNMTFIPDNITVTVERPVNSLGSTLSTGIYLYTLRYEEMVSVGRMLYLK